MNDKRMWRSHDPMATLKVLFPGRLWTHINSNEFLIAGAEHWNVVGEDHLSDRFLFVGVHDVCSSWLFVAAMGHYWGTSKPGLSWSRRLFWVLSNMLETEKMRGWFLHVWLPLSSMKEEVWWCFGGDTLGDEVTKLGSYLTNMAATALCSRSPSHSWTSTKFSSRLWKSYWTSGGVMCVRCPGLHIIWPKPNLGWVGPQNEGTKASSAPLGIPSGMLESHPSRGWWRESLECAKLSTKAKAAPWKTPRYKIYFG